MLSVVSVYFPGPNVTPNSPRYTNCAVCDSRTMSCAPFLISLSSSGNRNDSVSRESSVHSMMSMNCFFRKSMMAMKAPVRSVAARDEKRASEAQSTSLLRTSLLRRALLGKRRRRLRELRLELLCRQRARDQRTVGEDQRRRRRHAKLRPQSVGRDDGVVAVALVVRQCARREEFVPRLRLVGRAPDRPRLACGIRMELVDREQECVDRHVVDALELLLEPGAIRAI